MRYTPDQLEGLRQSPLVKKPDGLPSILQWMDVPAEQNATNSSSSHAANNGTARRTRGTRDGDGATAEHRTDRPLINPMGQFGRRQSMQPGEETVLGPPKLNFTSAARAAKNTGDKQERTGIVSSDGDQLGDRFPRDKNERWSRDGDRDRNRERGATNGRRSAREDGEGWTSVKGRKSLGQEDFERFNRNGDRGDRGDRNRDKLEGGLEDDAPPRRGQRERNERTERWGRRDETKDEGPKFGGGVQGGWRERAAQPQREPREPRERGDRDWDRGGHRGEEDPEWMDTKVEKKKEPQMKTQADFERWKEQMRAKDTPTEEKKLDAPTEPPAATGIAAAPMFTAPVQTPTAAEPTQGILFGNWGNVKGAELGQDESIKAKPKPAKASKFMSMFAKPEEQMPPSMPTAPAPASPAPHANEDQQGFQRILQMLGQVNVGAQAPPPPQTQPSPPNGVRGHGGGISLDFQQSPPPDMQNHRPPPNRTLEQQSILQNILAPRPGPPESRPSQQARFNAMSPENPHGEQFAPPRPESGRPEGQSPFQQPLRNATPQDANLAAILNSRAREDPQRDNGQKQRERDFLLTLMQQPRNTPPQMMNPNLPRGGPPPPMNMFDNMQHEQRGPLPQKGRAGIPPGFMEDPRMFNENDMMRQEAQRREQELRQQLNIQQQQQQQDLRNKNQRLPMGFPGHEDPALGLQRRNTAGEVPRQMTNMGIPSQQHPDMPFMGGRGQPGMPPTPQDRPNIAPPPGFGGPMRQPPGFGGPNPQQQMGPGGPSFSAGNTPLGAHPPGLPQLGGGSMRGMPPGFPGGNGMPGPPQGYFPPPPPGYGGPPGMRGEDPNMMFGFGGPGPRQQQQQQGRPGPPSMY